MPEMEAADRDAGKALNDELRRPFPTSARRYPDGKERERQCRDCAAMASARSRRMNKPKEHFEIGRGRIASWIFDAAAKIQAPDSCG